MEGYDAKPSPRIQQSDQIIQRISKHLQLPVALDPDSLKGLSGGMAVLPHFSGHSPPYDLIQLKGRLNGLVRPGLYYMLCYVFCEFIFTVISDHPVQLTLRIIVDNVSCCKGLPPVHTHVQRRVKTIGKASVPGIQLVGGYSQIKKDPVYALYSPPFQVRPYVLIIVVQDSDPVSKRSQPASCGADSIGVLVKAVKMPFLQPAAYLTGMAPSAQSTVHIDAVRLYIKFFDGLRQQHGVMCKVHFRHPFLSSVTIHSRFRTFTF